MPEKQKENAKSLQWNFRPSSPDISWEQYFNEYGEALHLKKNPPDEDEADTDIQITEPYREILIDEVSAAKPKAIIKHTIAAGFDVTAATSRTFKRGAVIKSGAKAGQRWADKDITNLFLTGVVPGAAAFHIWYSGAKGSSFESAKLWDRAGWPIELSDGEWWTNPAPRLVESVYELELWLSDMTTYPAPKERKKKEPAGFAELVEAGEWNG